jgi:endonuclease YncB( thermonuclease family)
MQRSQQTFKPLPGFSVYVSSSIYNRMTKGKGVVIGGVVAILAAGMVLAKTNYQVLRVIDGDTFETVSHQLIRINGIDAPELDACGGKEAKKLLEQLVLHNKVYLKVWYRDQYFRLVADAFTDKKDVGMEMILNGKAENSSQYGDNKARSKATQLARSQKLGIFSSKCTQTENYTKPECNIKGNNRDGGNEIRYYHYPGCGQYNNTIVQLHKGDRWFCSKKEAEAAGFVKGLDCK